MNTKIKQNYSRLKVTSSIAVQGDSGPVDAITLCYERRPCWYSCGCWGRGRRVIASFTFPREAWQCAHYGFERNTSAQAAVMNMGRLSKKDGNTLVRVTCLADGSPVLTQEITFDDLLKSLRLTKIEDSAVLFFSLGGGRLEGAAGSGQPFTAVFCNGRRLGARPDEHLKGGDPREEDSEDDCYSSTDDKWIEFMANDDKYWNIDSEDESESEVESDSEYSTAPEDDCGDTQVEYFPDLADAWNIESEVESDSEYSTAPEEDCGDTQVEYFPGLAYAWNIDSEDEWETDDEYSSTPEDEFSPKTWDIDDQRPPEVEEEEWDVWDVVGDCACVVSVVLVLYQAWQEYSDYYDHA